ncbi:AAA family ATPase [Opitutales bacterium ASA1]|uniref:AAA family ATPase n=1 Tax=Congregicoccus parvus TaxID=3081749 RepID=UPI002B3014A8|nr:AAA family ATPase [Opitutales bacterium ASA1]
MPRLHVLCGLPGSGKTTYALGLLRTTRAVRLANDDWMVALFGTNPSESEFRAAFARIEALQWSLALELLRCDIDVIWDYGVWSRAARADLHARCRAAGAEFVLYDISCGFETAVARVLARNTDGAPYTATLRIDRDAMEEFRRLYEPPSDDEGFDVVRVASG